jgi:hypothetical protein
MTNLVNVFIKSIWGNDKPEEVKQELKEEPKKEPKEKDKNKFAEKLEKYKKRDNK